MPTLTQSRTSVICDSQLEGMDRRYCDSQWCQGMKRAEQEARRYSIEIVDIRRGIYACRAWLVLDRRFAAARLAALSAGVQRPLGYCPPH